MTSNEIKALDEQNVMQTYGRFNVTIDRGEGATLFSPEGTEYIDFAGGIGVNSIGYGNKKWADAIYAQALKLQHISNLYYSEPYVKLAETLTKRTGMRSVFFSNSGAEANEGMIKLARKYSFDKYGKGRHKILTLLQSFHGRTVTTLAATGQDAFHKYFFPLTEGFEYIPANDTAALETAMTDSVCAVMIELVQGEGGVLPLDDGYVKTIKKLCAERDILLLIDEVQSGIGRTGSLFTFEQYGTKPDVVSFAKGIAGGLPMGGFLANDRCSKILQAGDHASTFGGNPLSAAAASVVLSLITPEFLGEVTKKGQFVRDTVAKWGLPCVGAVRGRGLMLGIPIIGAAPKELAQACVDNGLLIITAGSDALRMLPPLTITYDELSKGLAIMKTVLEKI